MKKTLASLVALMLLAVPMLALAEPLVIEELGISVELPEGYAVQQAADTEKDGNGVRIARAEDAPVSMFIVLTTMEPSAFDSFMENGLPNTQDLTSEITETDDGKIVQITHAAGMRIYCISYEDGVAMQFLLVSVEAPLTVEEIADFEAIMASVVKTPDFEAIWGTEVE